MSTLWFGTKLNQSQQLPNIRYLFDILIFSLLQHCHITRTRLHEELLLEHRKLSTEHKKLGAELKRVKAGARQHLNEQIQKVKDLEGKPHLVPQTHN